VRSADGVATAAVVTGLRAWRYAACRALLLSQTNRLRL